MPQNHHPGQLAAQTAFHTHWARLVSNIDHRSPHLRVPGAHFHHVLGHISQALQCAGRPAANFRVSDLTVVSNSVGPCALKARKSPPAAQMPTPGPGLPPEGLWGRCLYFGDTWRPPTARPPHEPRLWREDAKPGAKEYPATPGRGGAAPKMASSYRPRPREPARPAPSLFDAVRLS